jgi:hypothetical protein
MKKILLSISFLLASALALGQTKTCNLSISLISPGSLSELPFGDTLSSQFEVYNYGPDDIGIADTIHYTINDIPIIFTANSVILAGESQTFDGLNFLSAKPETDTVEFCFKLASHLSTNFVDDDTTNNTACGTIIFEGEDAATISTSPTVLGQDINIYPNPSEGITFVTWPAKLIIENLSLYKIDGTLAEINASISREGGIIDLSKLTDGMYLLQIAHSQGTISKRVIKR